MCINKSFYKKSYFIQFFLRRAFVGIFVGIFLVKRIFFNDISKSGGRHLHHHAAIYLLIVLVPSLDKPHL